MKSKTVPLPPSRSQDEILGWILTHPEEYDLSEIAKAVGTSSPTAIREDDLPSRR